MMRMNDRRGDGGRARWSDDLQVYPVGGLVYGAREARREVSRELGTGSMELADDTLEPIGELVGVLVAVDKRWPAGAPVQVGPFTLEPRPGEERFVSVVPLSVWPTLQTIEFRIFGLEQTQQPRYVSASATTAYKGSASQAAKWYPASNPPPDAFSDGERALRLTVKGGGPTMEWYHRRDGHVFDKVGADGFLRTVMVRKHEGAGGGGGWYKADDTVFSPED